MPQPWEQFQSAAPTQQPWEAFTPQSNDYLSRVGTDLNKRLNTGKQIGIDTLLSKQSPAAGMVQGIGTGFGAIGDVVGEAAKSLYNTASDNMRSLPGADLRSAIANKIGQGADYVAKSPVGVATGEAVNQYQDWAKANPQASRTVDAVANTAMVAPTVGPLGTAVSEAAGLAKSAAKTSILDPIALRGRGLMAMSPEARAELSQTNWDNASGLFKSSTANGAVIAPSSAQDILNYAKQKVGSLNSRTADTAGVLDDFQEAINKGKVTPDTLHEFRQNFNDVISSNTKSKIDGGGINLDGKKALDAKNAISEAMAGLTQKDLSAGTPQALSDMQEAINRTAQAHRFDRVSQMLTDAQNAPDAIKRGAERLLKTMKGLSPEETAALQAMAARGTGQTIERGLGTFGFDLGRYKNVALPALAGSATLDAGRGAAAAYVPHALPLVAVGTVARQTGKLAARGLGQDALDAIMERNVKPTPAAAPVNPQKFTVGQINQMPYAQAQQVLNALLKAKQAKP